MAVLVLAVALLGVQSSESQIKSLPPSRPYNIAQAAPAQAPAVSDFVQGDYWALIIGIDEYPNLGPGKQLLAGKPGAEAVARLLRGQYGFAREQIKTLYDAQAARGSILRQLRELRQSAGANDSIFLYFAGHCQAEPSTKEVWWLPADAQEDDVTSYISMNDLQTLLGQVPAQHIYLVADSCVGDALIGPSKITGTPTVQEAYQKKSRWVLASGVAFPVPDGDPRRAAPSSFSTGFVKMLQDNQAPYLTPLHIGIALAKVLGGSTTQTLRNAPMAGVGDAGGQFVFRLEGASITGTALAIKVPSQEDPRLASLQQQIEQTRGLSLPQALKDQAIKELQGQLDAVKQEIQAKEAEAKRQEEQRLAALRRQREEQDRQRQQQAAQAAEAERQRASEQTRQQELARQEEEKRLVALRQQEEARLAAMRKEAEEAARQAELKRQQEEARLAAMKKEAEEAARQAELKRQEEEKRLVALRQQEEARLAAMKKEAEEAARQAELNRQEEAKRLEALRQQQGTAQQAEAQRQTEEARQAELKRQQEEAAKRLAEERERFAAEQRQAEEAARQAELKRQEEEKRLVALRQQEEARLAAMKKEAEEAARQAELKRQEEEKRLAAVREEEAKRQAALQAQQQAAAQSPAQGPGTLVARLPSTTVPRPAPVAPRPEDLTPMVVIPAGEFVMGSSPRDGMADETPQRKVTLDAFQIDKYETTVGRYAKFLQATGQDPPEYWNMANPAADGDLPVVGVDWDQAQAYCQWAGKRLPTEAEWEKAARGTDGRKHPWGNEGPTPQMANYGKGGSFGYSKSLDKAGSFESGKSPYGVYDMIGNVWEWVADWYDKSYYQSAPEKNPKGPEKGEFKVIRGGSWAKVPLVVRAAGRNRAAPSSQTTSIGFRCAKDGS